MYNTKYDRSFPDGQHHPRTRFSISHELGHYFIEHHHAYLRCGGRPHSSVNEFRSHAQIEREADAFAASLLLPTHLVRPIVNTAELTLGRIDKIAMQFQTSRVSTAIRSVQLSDFPCAIAGIRGGAVAWMFPSESLIKAGLYPRRSLLSANAQEQWNNFETGNAESAADEGRAKEWFTVFERDHLHDVYVTEDYIPVPSMGTLLVLLTVSESDVFLDDEDDE